MVPQRNPLPAIIGDAQLELGPRACQYPSIIRHFILLLVGRFASLSIISVLRSRLSYNILAAVSAYPAAGWRAPRDAPALADGPRLSAVGRALN